MRWGFESLPACQFIHIGIKMLLIIILIAGVILFVMGGAVELVAEAFDAFMNAVGNYCWLILATIVVLLIISYIGV